MLRGSVTMTAWVGEAAREPGDLDFVVTPHTITSDSTEARTLFGDIVAALTAIPGAGLRPERLTESAIWTYERADGRRLVIPFSTAEAPDGSVQVDIVFGERLPLPPHVLVLPDVDVPLLAATAELSLAWKLLWLATARSRQLTIGPMTEDKLREVIVEPARRARAQVEEGLVEVLLRDTAPGSGSLPLLSHALLATWSRGGGRMTIGGYRQIGGITGAVSDTAESVFASLTRPQQELARRLFLLLVHVAPETEDTRRRVTAPAGSPLALLPLQAHFEWELKETALNQTAGELKATAMWASDQVRRDIDTAVRQWLGPGQPSRALAMKARSVLARAMTKARRHAEAAEHFAAIGPHVSEYPWYAGPSEASWRRASRPSEPRVDTKLPRPNDVTLINVPTANAPWVGKRSPLRRATARKRF